MTKAGKLKKPRSTAPSIFFKRSLAQSVARDEGDSVVPMFVDLDVEPVFIRGRRD